MSEPQSTSLLDKREIHSLRFLVRGLGEMAKICKKVKEGGGEDIQGWDDALGYLITFTMTNRKYQELFCQDLKEVLDKDGFPDYDWVGNGWYNADASPKVELNEMSADELKEFSKKATVISPGECFLDKKFYRGV